MKENKAKVKMINKGYTTINIICSKCKHEYSYGIPNGYKGRSKKCPKCNYQDPRK